MSSVFKPNNQNLRTTVPHLPVLINCTPPTVPRLPYPSTVTPPCQLTFSFSLLITWLYSECSPTAQPLINKISYRLTSDQTTVSPTVPPTHFTFLPACLIQAHARCRKLCNMVHFLVQPFFTFPQTQLCFSTLTRSHFSLAGQSLSCSVCETKYLSSPVIRTFHATNTRHEMETSSFTIMGLTLRN